MPKKLKRYYDRCYEGEELLRASEVGLAVADVVGGGVDGDYDGAVGVGGAAGGGIVGEEILGAELAVDAIEDGAEFLGRVGIEHGAAGGVGHGFEGVFTGGVAAAFVFHRADDDGVEERVGADGFLAGGVKVGGAGSFAGVGKQDDDAAAVVSTALEGARTEEHSVINRGAGAGGNLANCRLQLGDVIRKRRDLRHVFVEGENGQTVAGAQHLADKVGGSFLLEADLLVGAEAGVDHDGQVQRLRSFRFEFVNFLPNAFFKQVEGLPGKVRSGPVLFVEDADENIDEIDVDADAAALGGGILRVSHGNGRGGLDDFSGLVDRRRSGGRGGGGSRTRFGIRVGGSGGLRFPRPGRTVGLVLAERDSGEEQRLDGQE